MLETGHKTHKIPYHLILIFFILALSIWAAGYSYYRNQKETIKKEVHEELSAIADLKINQIVNWHKERLGDATFVFKNAFISQHAWKFLENPHEIGFRAEIHTWMKTLQESFRYQSVVLIDAKGNIQLSAPDGKEVLGPDAKRMALEAMQTSRVIFSDFYRSKITGDIRISLCVPLIIPQKHGSVPIGILLLRIDP